MHLGHQAVEVPLLAVVTHAVRLDQRVHGVGQDLVDDALAQVDLVEHLVAQGVDHLALLVHDLVVLEDVLAGLGVALDGGLRPLDGLGHHLRLEGVVGQRLAHHPVDGARGEQAHQVVLEAEVEAALAGVALAARAAAELVVDAAGVVPLGAQHVEPAQVAHPVALGPGLGVVLGGQLGDPLVPLLGVGVEPLGPRRAWPGPRGCRRG